MSALRPVGGGVEGGRFEEAQPLPGIGSIAFLRANGLGDLMFALPALAALRAAYPNARLTLLGLPWHQTFFEGRPSAVDDVFVLPPIPGVTAPEGAVVDDSRVQAAVRELRARRFDLGIQAFGGGRHSNPLLRAIGAGRTVGMRDEGPIAPLDEEIPYRYFQSEVLRLLEVVGLAGARPVTLQPRVTVTEADKAAAAKATGDLLSESGDRLGFVCIHPGAGDGRRRWPAALFGVVARALASVGYDVLVVGGAAERTLTQQVVAEAVAVVKGGAAPAAFTRPAPHPGRVVDLGGRLSLPALIGILHASRLLIGNDSGPLHLAQAVGTCTVGVFWCGNLINAGPMTRERHRPLLSWRLECPVCGVNCIEGECQHHESFVAEVSPSAVISEALSLLA